MRKLHLKLEKLEVESFPVEASRMERGTVQANSWTWDYEFSCRADTCSGGMLCACDTHEDTFCGTCQTNEASYCVSC